VTAVPVVVVDDSPVQRAHLLDVLEAERDIAVVGQAGDPLEAVALVQRLRPDVVAMDLGLPGEGGLGAIEQIMADVPTPILVLSTRVTCAASAAAVESLLAGAVEALPKPERWDVEAEGQLRCRVRLLSRVTVVGHPRGRRRPRAPDPHRAPPVAIAASTGGPAALAEILPALDGLAVPVLVVQHLHPQLVDGFVGWMQRVSALPVVVAADGDRPQPGVVYIAPAGTHLKLAPAPGRRSGRCGRRGPSRPAAAGSSSTPTRPACTGRRPTSCSRRSPPPPAGRASACYSPAWATTARPGSWPCAGRRP
jgi:two-component system chemotaxis response regulator CheB